MCHCVLGQPHRSWNSPGLTDKETKSNQLGDLSSKYMTCRAKWSRSALVLPCQGWNPGPQGQWASSLLLSRAGPRSAHSEPHRSIAHACAHTCWAPQGPPHQLIPPPPGAEGAEGGSRGDGAPFKAPLPQWPRVPPIDRPAATHTRCTSRHAEGPCPCARRPCHGLCCS